MKVLICGGAGYIGSHIVREFTSYPSYEIIILDNFSKGHLESIPESIKYEKGDICDKESLDKIFEKHRPNAVMHFCASIEVGESVENPLKYYENNVVGTIYLLQTMKKYDVKYFIFSSTAAIFGNPEFTPIPDDAKTLPINPYGDTKLTVEKILDWSEKADGIKYVCLRYFNACGAHESGEIGEDHDPESHLIPLILQVALGRREQIKIFGNDYDTRDGTCIRDYIHVTDLATAHIKALEYLVKENQSQKFNLGSGEGYSVKEVIEAARKVTNHPIPAKVESRRPGDPAILIAGSERAEKILGWKRKYTTIEKIVETAWKFHQNHPHGYSSTAKK
ncbi:18680_t:CDS:1 [Entrophospora sp. SA101]|nr:9066_t:CDS:1 [Entrophospora candida]CAH1764726.1 11472_t:CDS:1 [Entrophospora sp. SA101]CAG8525922.1 665_t:CDS:1 [Entrophospora candida]CAJ0745572.1 1642_t:CDS:1 [Entrophospora sp. SA101]CAJ0755371.1 18680_t:CDS:1 [Entrophospora sp. SA101]